MPAQLPTNLSVEQQWLSRDSEKSLNGSIRANTPKYAKV